ncbi:4Fe-4S binding protein [Sinanaerobacter chloroacetimidivorans]|uniref:4Fe-4S binding protein n=1 Tax=Sinanaerobacter chloroacetimidivorans TaxID=2818044 RepID=A0A8J7VWT0_9FIRM|nr:4Fe-4S binding protein [Sinanaerobacter chloroacetimidivorans]MBR0596492.1 4Fe-4S binding protein [Sinanaerobacter chloroacetimidivorans]
MSSFYMKTNKVFTPIRKYAWIFTLTVAIGGLWYPKLGLLVIPVILSLTLLSFFKGRYWCGNFCPHGSLFDSLLNPLSRNQRIPKFFRSRIFAGFFFLFFTANLIRKIIKVAGIFGTMQFWDKLGFIFVASYLMVTVVGGLLSIIISQRTWCQFCPMGMMQMLSYKLGKQIGFNKKTDQKVTASRKEMCHSCGKCSRVCPMQLTPYLGFSDQNQFDSEKCIRCSTCVANCPAGILSLNTEKKAQEIKIQTNLDGYENRQKIKARIIKIIETKDDVREISFQFLNPEKVNYKAGQFILVKIQEDPVMFRAYSISSYNEDGTGLQVSVKKAPKGYGTEIIFNQFHEGDLVDLEGPMGAELIIDKKAEKIVMIAGGIGITPFVPMVQEILKDNEIVKDVKLIYGVNQEKEFLYDDFFTDMNLDSSKFEYRKIVASDENWKGQKGFVTDVLKEMHLEGYKVYMCGPKPMIKPTVKQLKDQGVAEDSIFYESA